MSASQVVNPCSPARRMPRPGKVCTCHLPVTHTFSASENTPLISNGPLGATPRYWRMASRPSHAPPMLRGMPAIRVTASAAKSSCMRAKSRSRIADWSSMTTSTLLLPAMPATLRWQCRGVITENHHGAAEADGPTPVRSSAVGGSADCAGHAGVAASGAVRMAISSFDSTVISTESAAQLARCDELGAGNVLEHALRCSPAPRSPSIWLEREWRGLTARPVDRFSLDSLSTVVDRYASAYHRAGVGPRDVVALLLAEGIAPFVHYLALTRLGAIPAPINGGLARDDVVGYLRRLAPRALVADRTLHGAARRGIAGTDVLDVEARAPGGVLPEPYPYRHSAGDPVLIAHTSGTTGAPKPVTMLHGSFLHAVRTRLAASVRPGERVLSAVPHTHAAGIASFLTSTLRGAAKLVLSDLSAANLVRAVESFRPTTVVAFTGAYAELASLDLARHDLGSVDQWIATADAAHRRHVVALLAATARSRRGRPRPV